MCLLPICYMNLWGVTVVTGKWDYGESNKSRFVMDKSLLGSNKG